MTTSQQTQLADLKTGTHFTLELGNMTVSDGLPKADVAYFSGVVQEVKDDGSLKVDFTTSSTIYDSENHHAGEKGTIPQFVNSAGWDGYTPDIRVFQTKDCLKIVRIHQGAIAENISAETFHMKISKYLLGKEK